MAVKLPIGWLVNAPMGIPRLLRFLFIQGVQYFLLRVVVQDGHINEPDKPFILVFAPEGIQDGGKIGESPIIRKIRNIRQQYNPGAILFELALQQIFRYIAGFQGFG